MVADVGSGVSVVDYRDWGHRVYLWVACGASGAEVGAMRCRGEVGVKELVEILIIVFFCVVTFAVVWGLMKRAFG